MMKVESSVAKWVIVFEVDGGYKCIQPHTHQCMKEGFLPYHAYFIGKVPKEEVDYANRRLTVMDADITEVTKGE